MIDEVEREALLKAQVVGPTMIAWLEGIGIKRLADLKGMDAGEIAMRMDVMLGRRHLSGLEIAALENLIALADTEPS